MLKTVRDACEPHKVVFDFSPHEQVEDLGHELDESTDGRGSYAMNNITAGMRQLFDLGLKRLSERNDQAIFDLTQAMGGGKMHTMVATRQAQEHGPFEAPKTSVRITQHAYEDQTGQAVLEVAPVNAGPNGQGHYATKADVTPKSSRLMDAKLPDTEIKLWFRALGPSGERIAGELVPWSNALTISHQVREAGAKRSVELKVVPRGRVRYTLTGSGHDLGEFARERAIAPDTNEVW